MTVGLGFCLVMVVLLCVCVAIFFSIYSRLRGQYEALIGSYRNLEKLNSELRAQRHDYLNHLQVVYGLMELEEYSELKSYLEPVYKDMMKTGKALKTANPAVNALLRAKMAEAENRNVDFYVEVRSNLKELHMESWELCKVLSNIIDNGFSAMGDNVGQKKMRIDISEDRQYFRFTLSNNGPAIPEALQERIFQEGFSTKKESGHGMGLAIVMSVLKNYSGTLDLQSDEEETVFTICFPKEQNNHEERRM